VNIAQAILGGGTMITVFADAQGRYALNNDIGQCLQYVLGIGITAFSNGYATSSAELECTDDRQTINLALPPLPSP
jgi:hypothetical protein